MDRFIVHGGKPLSGHIAVSGAKNVALKILIASLLTDEEIVLDNVPRLKDVSSMLEILGGCGVLWKWSSDHSIVVKNNGICSTCVPLEAGTRVRTSALVLGPLLARSHTATIPNPGGCRLGARPIDRHIEGLKSMGANIRYDHADGFFHADAPDGLHGNTILFEKNTHTGTETILLAAVLAQGVTIIRNAAEEVEIDDLISCLNSMGADISRTRKREITIKGVRTLHGTHFHIMSDRNEEVTFAIAAAVTNGSITVDGSRRDTLSAFLDAYKQTGGVIREIDDHTTTYSAGHAYKPLDIVTSAYPGFMTDWQAPWAIMATKAQGISTIHETVFENRFSYVSELKKMGARIEFYTPVIPDPHSFYNFNISDGLKIENQAIRIKGPVNLHNAVIEMTDIRAGATMLLAALTADGESVIHGVAQIDRGYESIDTRLNALGAQIVRIKEEDV